MTPRDDLRACDPDVHSAIKSDDTRWLAETVPLVGHAERPVTAVGDIWIEWANCKWCGGTLGRQRHLALEVKP